MDGFRQDGFRTRIGTELVNEDNLKGFYMGDGATYIYRHGDEYLNVFPFGDWRKIPGITSYETDAPVPSPRKYGAHTRNESAFVGGVTDGRTGMTAMVVNRDGVHARKAWVMTNDYVLCLGAGIKTDSTLSLTTSVDQRKKRGELSYFQNNRWHTVNGTFKSNGKALRFYHDSTGYILMQQANSVAISEKAFRQLVRFYGILYSAAGRRGGCFFVYTSSERIAGFLSIPDITCRFG